MAALFFHSGAGTHVLQVSRPTRKFSHVEFESCGDKLRGGAECPLPELMDRKKRDIMERKGDKEDENKRQKQQKESSAAAL